jgi:hypothetical protein
MPLEYQLGISEAECRELETVLGFSLPEDYKRFLRDRNGIAVSGSDWVNLPFPQVSGAEIAFMFLFGFRVANRNLDVVSQTTDLSDDVTHLGNIVVIGDDGGNNPYVLVPRSGSYKVFYWDRTHLHDDSANPVNDIPEQGECGNMYLVSETFDDFWTLLMTFVKDFQFVQVNAY